MPGTDGSARESMRTMTNAFQVSQAIHVAAVLGIADLVHEGSQTVHQLAAATGTNALALDRLLQALASAGIFAKNDRGFEQTHLSEYLRSDIPGSIRAWAICVGRPYFWNTWGLLERSVRTGSSTFTEVYGVDPWRYRAEHPEENELFNAAMSGLTAGVVESIVTAYDFSHFRLLVDVGAGEGALMAAVLSANPGLHGIVFDQHHVVRLAGAALRNASVGDRCQVVGGNFFDSVPAGGDAYVLKSIVHDWDDAAASTILRHCREAVQDRGRLLLVERVLGPANRPDPARFTDLNMLLMLGGQERDPAGFEQLCAGAGFGLARIIPTSSGFSIVEAEPN